MPQLYDFTKCEFAKCVKARGDKNKGIPPKSQNKECRTCWRLGKAFIHDLLKCENHAKEMAEAAHKWPRKGKAQVASASEQTFQ